MPILPLLLGTNAGCLQKIAEKVQRITLEICKMAMNSNKVAAGASIRELKWVLLMPVDTGHRTCCIIGYPASSQEGGVSEGSDLLAWLPKKHLFARFESASIIWGKNVASLPSEEPLVLGGWVGGGGGGCSRQGS